MENLCERSWFQTAFCIRRVVLVMRVVIFSSYCAIFCESKSCVLSSAIISLIPPTRGERVVMPAHNASMSVMGAPS